MCQEKALYVYVSLLLVRIFTLIFIFYHSKFDHNVWCVLGVQDVVLSYIYIYLFFFGSFPHVGYDTMLSGLLLVFRRPLVIIYLPCVCISLLTPKS